MYLDFECDETTISQIEPPKKEQYPTFNILCHIILTHFFKRVNKKKQKIKHFFYFFEKILFIFNKYATIEKQSAKNMN